MSWGKFTQYSLPSTILRFALFLLCRPTLVIPRIYLETSTSSLFSVTSSSFRPRNCASLQHIFCHNRWLFTAYTCVHHTINVLSSPTKFTTATMRDERNTVSYFYLHSLLRSSTVVGSSGWVDRRSRQKLHKSNTCVFMSHTVLIKNLPYCLASLSTKIQRVKDRQSGTKKVQHEWWLKQNL